MQHLRMVHNCTLASEVIDSWESAASIQQLWGCGFCGEQLYDWDSRATHIAAHFRQGMSMDDWGDPYKDATLACPFYRYDSVKHATCIAFQLRHIEDVKQHVFRHHRLSGSRCQMCGAYFSSQADCDQHLLYRSCESTTPSGDAIQSYGITEEQARLLRTGRSSGMYKAEQWFSIWDIVFPGEAPPANPYISREVGKLMTLCWRFWATHGRELVDEFLREKVAGSTDVADATLSGDIPYARLD